MFNGDRFTLMSDSARFAWPYFWCASNTVGRIELNYHKVIARAFFRFRQTPTEEQFWGWIQEFRTAYLLFVYEADGRLWGQWDAPERFLPKYKLTADTATPAPEARQFLEWRNEYFRTKQAKAEEKISGISSLPKVLKTSKTFRTEPYGIGIGIGIGSGKENPCAANGAAPGAETTPLFGGPEGAATGITDAWLDRHHDQTFWPVYWRRVNKRASQTAFRKRVRTLCREQDLTPEEAVTFLCDQAALDRQRFEPTPDWEWRERLHPATWLNGERWNDEAPKETAPATGARSIDQRATEARQLFLERYGREIRTDRRP